MMNVNKRIGKWKQWTGEKLGQQAKTELSEDFQELQEDVALRRSGVDKLYGISKDVSKHLAKRVEFEDGEDGKAAVIEACGTVFAAHGDEFGADSAFGQALRLYGRAHQDVAVASKSYQDHFNSGWLSSLERDLAGMNEYDAQCKKLGSRRLTYDAALGKVQKSKKEKADLEADLRLARNRYEETSSDVQERALAIQAAEADQLVAITKLLEAEYAYVKRYIQILDDVKVRWPQAMEPSATTPGRRSRAATMTRVEGELAPPRSAFKSRSHGPSRAGSDDDDEGGEKRSRSKPPSIKTRSRSSTLTNKFKGAGTDDETSKPQSASRFSGLRIPGLVGTPSKEYTSVQEEGETSPVQDFDGLDKRGRRASLAPSLRRTHTAPPNEKAAVRLVEAKWDYHSAEADELELVAGDRVVVLGEINQDWYTGRSQRTGVEAMFPSAFVVEVSTPLIPPRALPVRKEHYPPTPPDEPASFMRPQTTGSDVSDAFADPAHLPSQSEGETDDDDDAENAALRPNGGPAITLMDRSPSANGLLGVARRIPVLPSSGTAKKPPPPPPPRRAHSSQPPTAYDDSEVEAFGNVAELKKRLGMGK